MGDNYLEYFLKRGICKLDQKRPVIESVLPGSIAEELEIEKGDILVSINSVEPEDLIDYKYLIADDYLELEIEKPNGESWVCEVEKEPDEDLGLGFAENTFDGIRRCANKCVFCFVDQMPPGMRKSLYVKDDDYRLSFLHGNFVTMTNLSETDINRILRLRLSPIYISVHTTDPAVRERMLGNKNAKNIMNQLTKLAEAGIEMHTQIVLCPGLNDRENLIKTINDLASLWPSVKSVAVVPVGLTSYREGLFPLRKFNCAESKELIDRVQKIQADLVKRFSCPFVYLADEFYVNAGVEVPPGEMYCDYPQLENGVGLVRIFYDSFSGLETSLPDQIGTLRNVAVVTGESGSHVLKPILDRLNLIRNLKIELIKVPNTYFGEQITVAGLLTGQDILNALKEMSNYNFVVLPSVMFKKDTDIFLDGMTARELSEKIGVEVRIADLNTGAVDFISKLLN